MRSCDKIDGGLPGSLKFRMLLNIILDFAVGLVPFIGDLADAAFHANTRNVVLLEEYLRQKGQKELRKSGLPIPDVDPSSPVEFDRMMTEPPPQYTSRTPSRERNPLTEPTRVDDPPLPQTPAEAKTTSGRGWFGRGKTRPNDVEMGTVHDTSTSGRSGQHRSQDNSRRDHR